jgi:ABC-type Fe3+-siderophore transport system permease subunit
MRAGQSRESVCRRRELERPNVTSGTSERGAWFFTVLGCLAVVLVAVLLVRWASSPRTLQTDDQTAFCSGLRLTRITWWV